MDTNFYHTRNYVYFGDPKDYKYNYCVCAEKTELQAQKTAELLNQCFEFIIQKRTTKEIKKLKRLIKPYEGLK